MSGNIIGVDLGPASGASNQAVEELQQRVDAAEDKIETLETQAAQVDSKIAGASANADVIEKIFTATGVRLGLFVKGIYYLDNESDVTTIHTSSYYKCARVPCNPGDKVRIRARSGSHGVKLFVDSEGNAISGSYTGSTTIEGREYTAPENAAAVLVNDSGSLSNPYVAVGSYSQSVNVDDINLSTAAFTPMTNEIDTSSNIPASSAVKTYVDDRVGDFSQVNIVSEITEQSHSTDAIPTADAVYNYVNDAIPEIGTAASKNAATSVANTNDAVPTSKAVMTYVSTAAATAVNNVVGTAGKKNSVDTISSNPYSQENVIPTAAAVREYVNSKTDDAESSAKEYTDAQVSILNFDVQSNARAIQDMQGSMISLGDAASKDITLRVDTSYDLPTSSAVKSYVDSAVSDVNDTVNAKETALDGRLDIVEPAITALANRITSLETKDDLSDKENNDTIMHINSPIESMIRPGTFQANQFVYGSGGTHMCFPIVEDGITVSITTNPEMSTMYAFLSDYTGLSATLCSGTSVTMINTSTRTADALSPSGAKYLYIMCSDGYYDYTPESVKINGIEMLYGIRERIDQNREENIGMRSKCGALGKDDWKIVIDGVTLERRGNLIKAYGKYIGAYTQYIKITGTLQHNTSVQNGWVDYDEIWPYTIPYYMNIKLQLQTYRHKTAWNTGSQGPAPRFSVYGVGDQTAALATRAITDDSLEYNANYICAGRNGHTFSAPWFIVMEIDRLSDFGSGQTYTVWLEDMTNTVNTNQTATLAFNKGVQLENQFNQISSGATYLESGLMSPEDKLKLDTFLDPQYYVTKFDDSPLYIYKGSVTDAASLPDEATANDAYYVESEGKTYVYNGTTWDEHGPEISISTIATAEIDDLF